MKVTIVDIAKKCKVTPSTVSRALTNNTRVSLKTRELIQQVAKEMGYQPNVIASSLRKGKSDTIGMIVPRINRHFFSNVISGVEEVLNPEGYRLLIMQSDESIAKEIKAVQALMHHRVAGMIVSLSAQSNELGHFNRVIEENIPLVQFDRVSNELKGAKIINTNYSGSYQVTKSLMVGGYNKVAHFSGSNLLMAYRERRKGYEDAIRDVVGDIDEELILSDVITRRAGLEAVKYVIERGANAVFCASDYSAFGVYEGLKQLGIRTGYDFGVAGFGNEPFAEMIQPTLSTVEQKGRGMGRISAQQVIKAISGIENDVELVVPVEFIKRESSIKT